MLAAAYHQQRKSQTLVVAHFFASCRSCRLETRKDRQEDPHIRAKTVAQQTDTHTDRWARLRDAPQTSNSRRIRDWRDYLVFVEIWSVILSVSIFFLVLARAKSPCFNTWSMSLLYIKSECKVESRMYIITSNKSVVISTRKA